MWGGGGGGEEGVFLDGILHLHMVLLGFSMKNSVKQLTLSVQCIITEIVVNEIWGLIFRAVGRRGKEGLLLEFYCNTHLSCHCEL